MLPRWRNDTELGSLWRSLSEPPCPHVLMSGEEYESQFWRDSLGIYDIEPIYFMPVVRNVPVFPDKDLQIGDTWEAEGQEAYDIRRTFNVSEPLIVPFTANYTYEGTVEKALTSETDSEKTEKKLLHVINVEYSIFYDIPVPKGAPSTYPVSSMISLGASRNLNITPSSLAWRISSSLAGNSASVLLYTI